MLSTNYLPANSEFNQSATEHIIPFPYELSRSQEGAVDLIPTLDKEAQMKTTDGITCDWRCETPEWNTRKSVEVQLSLVAVRRARLWIDGQRDHGSARHRRPHTGRAHAASPACWFVWSMGVKVAILIWEGRILWGVGVGLRTLERVQESLVDGFCLCVFQRHQPGPPTQQVSEVGHRCAYCVKLHI